jgi:putative inorganic carbon (hco3(-)) transporter
MGRIFFLISTIALIVLVFVLNINFPPIIFKFVGFGAAFFYCYCLVENKKFYVLAMVLLYLPLAKISPFSVFRGFNLTNILVLSLFFRYYFISPSGRSNGDRKMNKTVYFILTFIVFGLVQSLFRSYSDDAVDLISYAVQLSTPWLLYLGLTGCISSFEDAKIALFFSWCGSFLASMNGFVEFLDKRWNGSIERSRVGGPLEQPNMFGAFLAYIIPFMFAFMLFYGGRLRFVLLVSIIFVLKILLSTFSRGAYLAVGGATLAQLFFKGKSLFFVSVFAGLLSLALFPGLLPESVKVRMIGHTFRGGDVEFTDDMSNIDNSAVNRVILWEAAGEMIKESPLFGKGLLSFPYLVSHYLTKNVPERDTHNMYLKIAVYMGIPALIAYLYFFTRVIVNSHRILRRSTDAYRRSIALGAIGMSVSLLISSMFGSRMEGVEMLCYFMTGSALISVLVNNQEIKE